MSESEQDDKSEKTMEIQDDSTAPDKSEAGSVSGAEAKLKEDLEDMKNKYLYLRADFENYKRQAIKERSDLIKFGAEPVLREFLGVLDDLERATGVELKAENLESIRNGLVLITSQFKKTFERFGVEEVASKGELFDPQIHEALGTHENKDLPPNSIIDVFKKAYKLHGKVIRPAQVLVNSSSKGD